MLDFKPLVESRRLAVRKRERNDGYVVLLRHGEGPLVEWSYRGVKVPTASLREKVEPLLFFVQFVEGFVEFAHGGGSARNWNSACAADDVRVASGEILGPRREPQAPELDCLQNGKEIPAVNVVSDGDGPVLEEFPVLAYVFLADDF